MKDLDYSIFFEESLEMLCVANFEGYFTKLNPRWTEVLGHSEEFLKSKPFIEFVHPDDVEKTAEEAKKLMTGNVTVEFENRYLCADGKYKWLAWNSRTVGGEFYAVARDITSYKNQQRYYSEMQEAANIGYWRIDLETNTPLWSEKTYDIHEVPRGQKVEMGKAIEFYAPEVRDQVTQLVAEGMEKGVAWDDEFPFITAKGNRLWVRAIGKPVVEDGKVNELYGVFQDITEKKDAEMKLNYVFESVGDGFWDWHIQDDYEYMSPRFWEIFGYNHEEMSPHPSEWQKLIFKEDLESTLKNFERHVATHGEYPFSQEVRYRHKDGSTVWVICKGRVVEWGESGEPIRMVGSHTDITNQKLAQVKLMETVKLASLGEMAGGIAHEINNPLAIISGNANLLRVLLKKNEAKEEKIKPIVETIEVTVKRISKIIDGMRQLLGGRDSGEFKEKKFSSVVELTLSLCAEKIKSKSIQLDVDTSNDGVISCSDTLMSQLIINLIGNSIDALEEQEKPKISIRTIKTKNSISLEVEDSGPGIPKEIQELMFEPFYTTKETGRGTGLGLSLSKEIAHRHSGKLYLKPDSTHTCFVVELPLVDEPENE